MFSRPGCDATATVDTAPPSSHIDSSPTHDEEDDDGRQDRDPQKWREVPLRRPEQKRREAAAERTVRRQGEHEAGRVLTPEGCKRCGDPRRDQADRHHEGQRTPPGREPLATTTVPVRAIRSILARRRSAPRDQVLLPLADNAHSAFAARRIDET